MTNLIFSSRFRFFLLFSFLSVSLCLAQKDKGKYAAFNANNDVVVVYKSGTVALFSNPDLELKKEVSPGDKKNAATSCRMSESGKYLVVNDNKVKAWIVYDAATLEELNRISKKGYELPQFVGTDQIFVEKKLMALPDLKVVKDLSGHDVNYDGFAFSPSLKSYINYEIDGTGGEGKFKTYNTDTGEMLGNSKVDETESLTDGKYVISNLTQFIDEDKIAIVYNTFMSEANSRQKVVDVNMGKDFVIQAESEEYAGDVGITYDYQANLIVLGDYAVDVDGDFELRGMAVSKNLSGDKRFVVLGTPKNKLNLYENLTDSKPTLGSGKYKKSKMLKSIVVPAEK